MKHAPWPVFAVLVVYLLALNPWFPPDQYDDVLYYFGALSLSEEGRFFLSGWAITDWPPLFSLVLAALNKVLGPSVIMAKLVVMGFVGLGLYLLQRLWREQGRPYPLACTALAGLFPISLIMGTRVLSEWMYVCVCALFFMVLDRLRKRPSWKLGVLVGLLLAVAALTRYIGVFLGTAIVWQWFLAVREDKFALKKMWRPEIVAGIIGGLLWVGWRVRCVLAIRAGEAAAGNYAEAGYFMERFSNLDPVHFFRSMEEMIISFSKVARKLGASQGIADGLSVLVGLCIVAGIVIHIRKRGIQPMDIYVFVYLVLMFFDLKKPERYFMPLAPFICGYTLDFLDAVLKKFTGKRRVPVTRVLLGAWMAWLVTLNSVLLFQGNMGGTHAGFSMLVTRTPETYYQKDWLDLYQACEFIGENAPPGQVGVHGEAIAKYVLAFANRNYIEMERDVHLPHEVLLSIEGVARMPEHGAAAGWSLWKSFGIYEVYRKQDDGS